MLKKFDLKTFYSIGMLCFFIMALSNMWSLGHNWEMMDLGARIAKFFSIIFNFALVKMFSYLKQTLSPQEKLENKEISEKEMLEIMEKLDLDHATSKK